MLKRITLFLLACSVFTEAHADFNYDVEGGFVSVERRDIDTAAGFFVGGSYYFGAVDTSLGPLAAAAFLDKASFVRAATTDVLGRDAVSLDLRLFVSSNVFFDVNYVDSDVDSSIGGSFGVYPTDTSALRVDYAFGDVIHSSWGVNYKTFWLNANATGWSAELGFDGIRVNSDSDATRDNELVLSGGLTYYPLSALSIGGTISIASDEEVDGNSLGIHAQYFFNSSLFITAAFGRQREGSVEDEPMRIAAEELREIRRNEERARREPCFFLCNLFGESFEDPDLRFRLSSEAVFTLGLQARF